MKKNILIVDDNQNLINSMKRDLRKEIDKFDIHTTIHGQEAMKLIEENNIDLLITDILMPEKEGIEIIREARDKFPSIKIIAKTGGRTDYLKFAKLFGASHTLNKPFSKDELILTIERVLNE